MRVLRTIAEHTDIKFDITDALFGGAAIDATGNPLPDETLEACKNSDGILLGAFEGNFAEIRCCRWTQVGSRPRSS